MSPVKMSSYSSTVSRLAVPATAMPRGAEVKAHHRRDKGGKLLHFENPHPSFGVWRDSSMLRGIIKTLGARLRGKWPAADVSKAGQIPTAAPVFQHDRLGSKALRLSWLGHACCFVEFASGLRVLFDPVFEDRIGPGRLGQKFGTKRLNPAPCALSDLPAVDAVVISHSHPDHLSWPSVQELVRLHPRVPFFVPLGLVSWFRDGGIQEVHEMDWWEDAELVLTINKPHDGDGDTDNDGGTAPQTITARISCLPCQHTTWRTGLGDRDITLWASWAVTSGGKSVWFAGDTGYRTVPDLPDGVDDYGPEYGHLPRSPHFAEIGQYRGPFDLAIIPIGAYKPRYLLSPVHANPFDAVEMFQDVRCKRAVAMHWGTWALSAEEVTEPPRLLREALRRKGLSETGVFDIFAIGESRDI